MSKWWSWHLKPSSLAPDAVLSSPVPYSLLLGGQVGVLFWLKWGQPSGWVGVRLVGRVGSGYWRSWDHKKGADFRACFLNQNVSGRKEVIWRRGQGMGGYLGVLRGCWGGRDFCLRGYQREEEIYLGFLITLFNFLGTIGGTSVSTTKVIFLFLRWLQYGHLILCNR